MKALSIQQPWADLILLNGKDIENRTWALHSRMIGQRIYIHAGKKIDLEAHNAYGFDLELTKHRTGVILGEVTIVECVTSHDSPWFHGPYGFVLKDPLAYTTPMPCKGRLGFFQPDVEPSCGL